MPRNAPVPRHVDALPTPALVLERSALFHNLDTMSAALPGARLRPHVKAHKCTELARLQHERGHRGFTCATAREVEGMARAGLGDDLLLANESVDPDRLRRLARLDARVTVAVDSRETVRAAAAAGLREVLVDVNVGLPRCGCAPDDAGRIAEFARRAGLEVRGVMGYEGHVVGIPERARREQLCNEAMEKLARAHAAVGGDVISAGGTGTWDCNAVATEIQAGSYLLMDTAYAQLDSPFRQALFAIGTVISVSREPVFAVGDVGLKALGMDHGDSAIDRPAGRVWFFSDEHVTFSPAEGSAPSVGSHIRVAPAHCDPTVAYHERVYLVDGEEVIDAFDVDLRGW